MTKFLVDQDVNQMAIRAIPIDSKGFDILYPQDRSYSAASDHAILKLATQEGRTFVTGDRDFERYQLTLDELPNGILLIRPPRSGQRRVQQVWGAFCTFLQTEFPEDPYNFSRKFIDIRESEVRIQTEQGPTTFTLPEVS